MDNAEKLKKYKELLDSNIITQEEFEKKKNEVLNGDVLDSCEDNSTAKKIISKISKLLLNQKLAKKIAIVIGIIAILVAGGFGIKHTVEKNQQSKREAALEAEIQTIMNRYGIYSYAVKYVDYSYDVFAVGFESLTNGEALKCLKELDNVSIDDPCGDGKIDFGMTDVHPGLDVDYSYWRVSSTTVMLNEMYGGNYKTPGIYCNQYGLECIYACEN